jgi:hypothetical protein
VLSPQQSPVDNARVWSTLGGEAMKIEGGWLVEIPVEKKPADGKFTIYAEVKDAFWKGSGEVQLGQDRNQSVTIPLDNARNAKVRGIVQDSNGNAVEGALVSVTGYGREALRTGPDGNFELPAHAADGQMVRLHAEKVGYGAVNQDHPAGEHTATLVLERTRGRTRSK